MSYLRASTGNPNGWRPGTVRLGDLQRLSAPNWKTSYAHMNAAHQIQRHRFIQGQRARMVKNILDDAAARRVAPMLSGLGLSVIDLNAQMARGAAYLFHFTRTGVTLGMTNMAAVAQAVALDSNFLNPVAAEEPNGFQVAFTYNGQGSTVGNAGREMQQVINDHGNNGIGIFATGLFSSAEGGPATAPAQGVTVLTTSPDGTIVQFTDGSVLDTTTGIITSADGTVKAASTTAPGGVTPPGGSGSFNFGSFFSGLGVGGAVAIGLGAVLLIKSL